MTKHHVRLQMMFFLAMFLFSAPTFAATYYISSSEGSDNNTGTLYAPWKTLAKVQARLFFPGDHILLKKGDTWDNESLHFQSSGNQDTPITIGAYGEGEDKPLIDGNNSCQYGLKVTGSWITIEGLAFTGQLLSYEKREDQESCSSAFECGSILVSGSGRLYRWFGDKGLCMASEEDENYQIHIDPACNVILKDITVQNSAAHGIHVMDAQNVTVTQCAIKNIENRSFACLGIFFDNVDDSFISNCSISHVDRSAIYISEWPFDTPNMADGKQFWHTLPSRSCRIDHNNIINAGQLAVVIGGYDNVFEYNINQGNWHHYPAADDDGAANGISTMFSSNPIIRYNVNVGTHRNAQQGDGCGFFVDHLTYNGQIYGNFSLHNDGGGVCIRKSYNTKIFNNMLYANAQVYGIGITSGGIWVFNDAPPSDQYTEVFNNILLDNKYADVCASDVSAASPLQIRFHHNLYFSNERAALFRLQEKKPEQDQLLDYRHDFSAWQAMGFDAASMWADPKLRDPANDQFQLTSRSPCISAGIPSADNLRIFPARLDYALENMSSDFLSFLLVEQDTARGCALGPYLFSAKNDTDTDGIENDADMCPATPDGPMLGTCVKQFGDTYIGTDMVCTDSSDCGVNYTCQMSQDDLNLNGIADACECQADITGPVRVRDGRVNSFDMMVMKKEIKGTPCLADINCDNKVDGFDLAILKVQFNKAGCFLP